MKIIEFFRQLFCRHNFIEDNTRSKISNLFLFVIEYYRETKTPIICTKCNKQDWESDIL